MEIMLDTKQIQEIFLFELKIGHKAAETTHIISSAFGPGTAKERTVQWWFKKFCKRDKSLEDEKHSSQASEVDNDQLRASLKLMGFPDYSDYKQSACNAWDLGLIPGLGRFPTGGHGNPLQYPCLENPMDRGGCWATVHRVSKSRTQLSD